VGNRINYKQMPIVKIFHKILIANRGEIAVRIIGTARRMGIKTVALYTGEESDALHATIADEKIELHGNSLAETYLNRDQIISIALQTGVDAIHPGYGFLSENENFALACEKAEITFIGPSSRTIALMGNKPGSREIAAGAGIPVIRGFTGSTEELVRRKDEFPYPVIVKAAAGGGGKAMRMADSPERLEEALATASREALSWFGDDSVYIEQYIKNARHIEVQILGDKYGNIIHLYERECSIQRRYQKIIEESPSPSVTSDMRDKITESALRLAWAIDYSSAGTIEFLADDSAYYFLEMNTRLQVEHPVTEAVTNIDIVEEQILIASGYKLRYTQDQIMLNGHAIECRVYAEIPLNGFIPSPGVMTCYEEPDDAGVRVDSAFNGPARTGESYDPLIAKIITHEKAREPARKKMITSLGNFGIHGIRTNILFLLSILHDTGFIENRLSTSWCEINFQGIFAGEKELKKKNNRLVPGIAAFLASLGKKQGRNPFWENLGYWRIQKKTGFSFENEIMEVEDFEIKNDNYKININGMEYAGKFFIAKNRVTLSFNDENCTVFISENREDHYAVSFRGFEYSFSRDAFPVKENDNADTGIQTNGSIFSNMPGRVVRIQKAVGETVHKGEILIIVESMKMENNIMAPADGLIETVEVAEGEPVDQSTLLMVLKG
jgi:3-methylcrotonyl-CoA carboxylase alpha subunit